MKKIIPSLFLLVATASLYAQGNVSVTQSEAITQLMNAQAWVPADKVFSGWSIQLIVSDDRYKAEEVKTNFLRRYPEMVQFLDFENPYYRFRVGAFLNKTEANAMLKRLSTDYPDAYLMVNTKIHAKDLI